MKLLSTMTLALAGAFGMASAQAAPFTVYTDQSIWTTAASGSVVIEDFADTTLQTGLSTANGLISGGKFAATASTQFNDATNPRWNFTGSTAFGADFDFEPGGAGDGLILAIGFADGSTGSSFIGNPAGAAFAGFWGIVSTVAVTSVRFDSPFTGVEAFTADNLRFLGTGGGGGGGGGTVSLPSSLALAAAALGLLAGSARSRRGAAPR